MTNATLKPAAWYQSRLRLIGCGSALCLLALPAIAMMAGADGVVWTASDFVIFAVMLGLLGGGIELSLARSSNLAFRLGAIAMCVVGFLTIWVNGAVGMIGSENNPYNLLFLAIVGLVALNAFLVRGSARGLSRIALVAGGAQLALGAVGYATDPHGAVFSMAFAAPWWVAAALFANAGRR